MPQLGGHMQLAALTRKLKNQQTSLVFGKGNVALNEAVQNAFGAMSKLVLRQTATRACL